MLKGRGGEIEEVSLSTLLRFIIAMRELTLEEGDLVSSVNLTHFIAMISQGCVVQVKRYVPEEN